MTETPRQYKKRIDEKRKKNAKNRDKLIREIENYELVDDDFKSKTKQEILDNFEKNLNADKDNELYLTVGKELEKIDVKYKELETLKEDLRKRVKEQDNLEVALKEFEMSATDKTTLMIQMSNFKKMNTKLEELLKEIEGLEKSIEKRENEIKEIEEAYGKKQDATTENPSEMHSEESTDSDKTMSLDEEKGKNPSTLKEYHEQTIKDLWKINHTRHEIIRLLDEGTGIDDDIKNKIQQEVSSRFFDYYVQKQGSLRMKAARYQKNVDKTVFIIDEDLEPIKIGNRTATIASNKGGKQCVVRLEPMRRYSRWFDHVAHLNEVGGKPVFRAINHGERGRFFRGNEQCGDLSQRCSHELTNIGGEPVFIVKDDYYYLFKGNEKISDGFDDISDLKEVGGRPFFKAREGYKRYIMRGNERYSDDFDGVGKPIEVGGYPLFCVIERGKIGVIWKKELCGGWFDTADILGEIGENPVFKVVKDGKECIFRGKEQCCDWCEEVGYPEEIGRKPAFKVKNNDGKECIFRGKKQCCDWSKEVGFPKEIGGKPAFWVRDGEKEFIMRGNQQYSEGFNEALKPFDVGGKPAFKAKNNDGKWVIFRGKKQCCDWSKEVGFPKEIGGKPAFSAENSDGKWAIFRGNQQYSEGFNEVSSPFDVGYVKEIGGKPAFKAKNNDGKWVIFRGKKQYSEGFNEVSNPFNVGGKPAFKAKNKEGKWTIFRGKEQCCDWSKEVGYLEEIGGKPAFWVRDGEKEFIMRGNQQYSEGFNEVSNPIDVGGKPAFKAKNKEGKWTIFRGKEQCCDWSKEVGGLIEIGGKPAFRVKNGKKYIYWGNQQYSDGFFDVTNPIKVGNAPVFKARNLNEHRRLFRGEKSSGLCSEIEGPTKIGGKTIFWGSIPDYLIKYPIVIDGEMYEDKQPDSNENFDSGNDYEDSIENPRDIREILIIERYEKFLNMKNLLEFLRKNKIFGDKTADEFEKKVRINFFENFDKAKNNKEFKDADIAYKELKSAKIKHKKIQEELIGKEEEEAGKKDDVKKRMDEIANMAMNLETTRWKKLKLKKIKKERAELENRQKSFRDLRLENVALSEDIKRLGKYLGPQKDRSKLKKKSTRKGLDFIDLKSETTLKGYKDKYVQIIKDKEELFNRFREIEFGIDDEIKNEVLEKLEIYVNGLLENKESDEILKEVDKIEEYLRSNLDDIIQKLKELEVKISDKKSQLDDVMEKKKTAQCSDLLKFNEMIYSIKSEEIELEDEYNQEKLMINELLIKYDGSNIDDLLN